MRCLLENETNECVLARPAARIFLGRAPGGRQGALLSSAGVWQGCDGDGGAGMVMVVVAGGMGGP